MVDKLKSSNDTCHTTTQISGNSHYLSLRLIYLQFEHTQKIIPKRENEENEKNDRIHDLYNEIFPTLLSKVQLNAPTIIALDGLKSHMFFKVFVLLFFVKTKPKINTIIHLNRHEENRIKNGFILVLWLHRCPLFFHLRPI